MDIKISEMTGKLKGIPAINTNPLSNTFCQSMRKSAGKCICKECYSCAMLKSYRRNCVDAFERNSIALSTKRISKEDIPKIKKNDIVRLHAHGELINNTHLLNLLDIVKAYPTKTFSLYTKRIDLVNGLKENIPNNLILVYSNPIWDAPTSVIPNGFHKVFNVLSAENNLVNCGGKNCDACRNCYDKSKENVIYELIK